MKVLNFRNGLTLLMGSSSRKQSELSLVIKTGHINEPKLGLAALYENIIVRMARKSGVNLIPSYGGNLTAFTICGDYRKIGDMRAAFTTIKHLCCAPELTDADVALAADDIVQHTIDLAPVPKKQVKLAYKHTAFGSDDVVWDTEAYIAAVKSLTVDDVKQYIADNYVGNNLVVSYVGPQDTLVMVYHLCEDVFSDLPEGHRTDVKQLLYTGGFQKLEGNGNVLYALIGWDISKLSDFAETNVLMTMLSSRLERELSPLGVDSVVSIAGYFGFRTLRVVLRKETSEANQDKDKETFAQALDILARNVVRAKTQCASDRRLETSCQNAMTQRLAISNEKFLRTVEAAWLHLDRNVVYDNNRCINNIWRLDAVDVRDMAEKIFAQKATIVLYGVDSSYEELVAKMK